MSAAAAGAQTPATIALKPTNARLSEEFTVLGSIRELSDGRVLVSDEKDKRLVVADLKANTVAPIGRLGDGPGEYRQPGQLYAFGGDTTVVPERFLRRWMLLDGARHVSTIGPDALAASKTSLLIYGSDSHGSVVALDYPLQVPGMWVDPDSVFVTRYERGRGRVDTLARAATTRANAGVAGATIAEAVGGRGGSAAGKGRYMVGVQTPDQVAMFADGWIAIAHARPYHVDWCAPAPAIRCTVGAAIVAKNPPMTEREKSAYLAWIAKTTKWPPTSNVDETGGWPDIVPPFVMPQRRLDGRGVFAASDGRLVIERFPSADEPATQYDIIDRRGVRTERMALRWNQRIVGFGAASVYVAVVDGDGIERLERHPWP
jgi:hypothetical protein